MGFNQRQVRRTRELMTLEVDKRKKHLHEHRAAFERIFDRLFTIIDRCPDHDVHVYRVLYFPRSRIMKIGMSWNASGYPRRHGYFMIWRGGVFDQGDIDVWPKTVCRLDKWTPALELSDQQLDEQILTAIGAPWGELIGAPAEVGAVRHDTRLLLKTAHSLLRVDRPHYRTQIEDICAAIQALADRAGVDSSFIREPT